MAHAGWMRNYHAMGDAKLAQCLNELEGQYGDAYQRVQNKGGLLYEHVQEARTQARSRGMKVEANDEGAPTAAAAVGVLTDPMECSECGRNERHYADDYICRICRDAQNKAEAAPESAPEDTPSRDELSERLAERLKANG